MNKFFYFLIFIVVLLSCNNSKKSIITTKNYNRLFQDISIIGLITILFIFIFIFKNSIKCLHLEKHEFYIFTIVIISSIVLLNLIIIISILK